MSRLTSQISPARPSSITNLVPPDAAGSPGEAKTPLVSIPEQAPVSQDTLPRQRLSEDPSAIVGFNPKPVAAVLLGITGAAVVLGSPVAASQTPVSLPPPAGPTTALVVAPAEGPPSSGAAVAAAAIASEVDATRTALSAEVLAEARRDAWSAFLDGGATGSVEHLASLPDGTLLASADSLVSTLSAEARVRIPISGSVGAGGANAKADVERVQTRLQELGFKVTPDGQYGPETLRAIRVFESILTGAQNISAASGKIVPGGMLHRALASEHAPRWEEIPASGTGFINGDTDGHSYAASRLVSVLADSARTYHEGYRALHPSAAPMTTNDASLRRGGDTPDHETHENGLDLDILMPTKSGGSGAVVGWRSYDREAVYAMIEAFASDARVERILIGDQVLLQRIARSEVTWKHKVQDGGAGHRDHFHVDVAPPTIPGVNARSNPIA